MPFVLKTVRVAAALGALLVLGTCDDIDEKELSKHITAAGQSESKPAVAAAGQTSADSPAVSNTHKMWEHREKISTSEDDVVVLRRTQFASNTVTGVRICTETTMWRDPDHHTSENRVHSSYRAAASVAIDCDFVPFEAWDPERRELVMFPAMSARRSNPMYVGK